MRRAAITGSRLVSPNGIGDDASRCRDSEVSGAFKSARRSAICALFVMLITTLATEAAGEHSPANAHAVEVQMRNVMYHFTDKIAVYIRRLHGNLVPQKSDLPVFDDKDSFTLDISSAEIAMSTDSLANLLNSYVFVSRDAPIKNVSVRIENDRLKIKGKLHSK